MKLRRRPKRSLSARTQATCSALGRNVAIRAARERFGAGTLAQNVDVEEGSVLGFHAFGRGNGSVSIGCSASSRVTEEFIRQYCPACLRALRHPARRLMYGGSRTWQEVSASNG